MASDSAVLPPSQQSVKAYVDAKKIAGDIVQVVSTSTSAYAATAATITPIDDTIPQKTEGDELFTLAITPKSATNKLIIIAYATISGSAACYITTALHQDDVANALAATMQYCVGLNQAMLAHLTHYMTAGTTSEITFKIRAGSNTGNGIHVNGLGGRYFGGVASSGMIIVEVQG
jgi:hypothetical protein